MVHKEFQPTRGRKARFLKPMGGVLDLPDGQNRKRRESALFIYLALAGSLYLVYLVLAPVLDAIVFAAVLAFLLTPLYERLLARTGPRENLSAFLVVAGGALVLVVPLLLLLSTLVVDGIEAMARLQAWLEADGLDALLSSPRVTDSLDWVWEKLPFGAGLDANKMLLALSRKAGDTLLRQGGTIAANAAGLMMGLFVFFFVLFYFVRDGRRLLADLRGLTPLASNQGELIAARVAAMAKAVFVGTFLTALAQGLAGGVGFAIVGIKPFFWGAVLALASLVPVVGTALVWVPAALWLLLTGNTWGAVFLAVWCVAVVGSIDNFLRPFLMRGDTGLSPLFVFLGVVGGLSVFGLAGILYGPLILTLAAALLDLYRSELLGGGEAGG